MDELDFPKPKTAVVPSSKRNSMLLEAGGQMHLQDTLDSLEKLQKQHPSVAGLAMAVTVVRLEITKLQLRLQGKVLTIASAAGLPIADHGITSDLSGEEIVLSAVKETA